MKISVKQLKETLNNLSDNDMLEINGDIEVIRKVNLFDAENHTEVNNKPISRTINVDTPNDYDYSLERISLPASFNRDIFINVSPSDFKEFFTKAKGFYVAKGIDKNGLPFGILSKGGDNDNLNKTLFTFAKHQGVSDEEARQFKVNTYKILLTRNPELWKNNL